MIRFLLLLIVPVLMVSAQSLESKINKARARVFPALVHIQPIKEFVEFGEPQKVQITGSGFIFTPDGYVLTNNHVAEKAKFVLCVLSSKQEVEAEVVGLDPWTDLAVLKLKLKEAGLKRVPYAPLGNSDRLQVGQIVLALGSPLGLARSLSMGVISSVDRYFEDMGEMTSPYNLWIQTDAAINPGNSGGPLIDLQGRVIGINARAITFGENLGFAIPINTAKYVIDQLLKNGEVERSWIGVEWQEIKEFRTYSGRPNLEGVLVAFVSKNSPAEKAGIKPGMVVTEIDGQPVSAVYKEELPKVRLFVSTLPVGKKIKIRFLDANFQMRETVLTTEKLGKFSGNEYYCAEWGMSVKEITPRLMKEYQLNDSKGVLVSGVVMGGRAQEAGVFAGTILKKVDNQNIQSLQEFTTLYENSFGKDETDHLLLLKIGDVNRFALIKGKTQE